MRARPILAGAAALVLGAVAAAGTLYVTDDDLADPSGLTSQPDATSTEVVTTTTRRSGGDAVGASPGADAESTNESSGSEQARAVAIVEAEGYKPVDPQTYAPQNTLTALVGINAKSATGTYQHAFFFVDGEYIGTDTESPSAHIDVAFQRGDEVALSYALYKATDPNCCPTDGSATVRYHWDGQTLEPLDPIPPTGFDVDGSRR